MYSSLQHRIIKTIVAQEACNSLKAEKLLSGVFSRCIAFRNSYVAAKRSSDTLQIMILQNTLVTVTNVVKTFTTKAIKILSVSI